MVGISAVEQCSARTEVHALYWLVRLLLKAGSDAYTLEQSTSWNHDSISINRTALHTTIFLNQTPVWVCSCIK